MPLSPLWGAVNRIANKTRMTTARENMHQYSIRRGKRLSIAEISPAKMPANRKDDTWLKARPGSAPFIKPYTNDHVGQTTKSPAPTNMASALRSNRLKVATMATMATKADTYLTPKGPPAS